MAAPRNMVRVRDIFERLYAVRLDRICEQPDARTLVAPMDAHGILAAANSDPVIAEDDLR